MNRVKIIMLSIMSMATYINVSAAAPTTDRQIADRLGKISERYAIIPEPRLLTPRTGFFTAKDGVLISACHDSLSFEVEHLKRVIVSECGVVSTIMDNAAPDDDSQQRARIHFSVDPTIQNPEGYKLIVDQNRINIIGANRRGIFYGIETLRQLIAAGIKRQFVVPCVEIEDSPRFGHRGMMLDPARNFLPVEDIKRFVDAMAMYKFNKLHLHLSDDQGWRIEVPQYPRLTTIGATRPQTNGNGKPQSGYYTADDLRKIVAYAADRNIEVIPEIEMPCHTLAALAAYPSLGCNPQRQIDVATTAGLQNQTLCMGNDSVYTFIDDIVSHLASIFPSPNIHVGGDAAPLAHWNECPKCKARIASENLKDTTQMLSYFMGRVNQSLAKHSKRPMVWYEINGTQYPDGSTAYAWRQGTPTEDVIHSARQAGHNVICAPSEYAYFDYPQWNDEEMAGKMPLLSLKQTYEFDPGYGLPADQQAHILGIEATLWGEYMKDVNRVFYMTFPRALALSEAAWSDMTHRSWLSFSSKLHWHISRLMLYGIEFRIPTELYHQ